MMLAPAFTTPNRTKLELKRVEATASASELASSQSHQAGIETRPIKLHDVEC